MVDGMLRFRTLLTRTTLRGGVGHDNIADGPLTRMLTLVGRLCPCSLIHVEEGAQLQMAMVWPRYAFVGATLPCHIISRAHRRPRPRPRRNPLVATDLVVETPRDQRCVSDVLVGLTES